MDGISERFRIIPFRVGNETHFANFDGDKLIAYCHHESSAQAVRDEARSRAERSEG